MYNGTVRPEIGTAVIKREVWAALIKPVRAKCLQGWKWSRCWTPKAGGTFILPN